MMPLPVLLPLPMCCKSSLRIVKRWHDDIEANDEPIQTQILWDVLVRSIRAQKSHFLSSAMAPTSESPHESEPQVGNAEEVWEPTVQYVHSVDLIQVVRSQRTY